MKTATLVGVGMWVLLTLGACSPDESSVVSMADPEPDIESEPLDSQIPDPSVAVLPEGFVEGSVSGEVADVDLALGTFSLADEDDTRWEFILSDTTEITDESGARGLAETEGSRAVVYYEGDPGARRAIRIEILNQEEGIPLATP